MRPLLLTIVMLAHPALARAADWYVEQAAATGGDGSAAKPFQKINDVKGVLKTGDTVWLRTGVYNEKVDFWHVKTGTSGRTTIRAATGHKPVIDGAGLSGFVFQAGETHYMTFRDLTVRNANESAFHFYKADHGEVIDCTTENVGAGVSFYFSSFGLVSGSDISGGINGKASDGTVLQGNKIHNSKAEGITLHADSKNCKYLNNIVYDNYSVNIYIDSASDMVVDGNLVYMTFTPTTKEICVLFPSPFTETLPAMGDLPHCPARADPCARQRPQGPGTGRGLRHLHPLPDPRRVPDAEHHRRGGQPEVGAPAPLEAHLRPHHHRGLGPGHCRSCPERHPHHGSCTV